MSRFSPRKGALAFLVVIVILGGGSAPHLAGWIQSELHFNFGPGDHYYLQGFEPMWEIDPDGLATHWSTYESGIRLPVTVKGGKAKLSYRFSRIYGQTAEVEIRVNGVPADRFSARGGAYVTRSVEIPGSVLETGPLEIHLNVDSHEGKNRGLRMDWLQIESAQSGSRPRITPVVSTVFWSMGLSFAFFILVYLTLHQLLVATALMPFSLLLYGALVGPYPLAHMLSRVAPTAITLTTLVVVVLVVRRNKDSLGAWKWVPTLTFLAFLLRAGGMFHPQYYYPDLRAHADMARIVSEAGLDFWMQPSKYIEEQGVWTAESMGKSYAFPFSPIFHALFAPWDLDLISTMEAMKLIACLLSCLEVPLVFFLARRLGNDDIATYAAALVVISPPVLSRLSLAFMAAIFAHTFDVLTLASLSTYREKHYASFAVAGLFLVTAMGSYAGSLVNFGLFVPLFGGALLIHKSSRRTGTLLLGGSAAAAVLVLGLVYREFLGVFVSEIFPRFFSGESRTGEVSLVAVVRTLAQRTWIFYDGVYLPLMLGGAFLWFKGRRSPFLVRFVAVWALVYVLLITLRTTAPDLFAKVKEILWVAPLVAIFSAAALDWIRRSLPRGLWLAAAYYMVLAYYGVSFYAQAIHGTFELAR